MFTDVDDEVLKALAEPRRRAILRLVADDELAAGEIAAAFDVTRPAISQHLTVLRVAGLLHERRDGTRRLYRARAEGLARPRALLDELWRRASTGPEGHVGSGRRTDRSGVDRPGAHSADDRRAPKSRQE